MDPEHRPSFHTDIAAGKRIEGRCRTCTEQTTPPQLVSIVRQTAQETHMVLPVRREGAEVEAANSRHDPVIALAQFAPGAPPYLDKHRHREDTLIATSQLIAERFDIL